MSTEDDLFRVLKRISFQEVRLLIRQANIRKQSVTIRSKILLDAGWTSPEYKKMLIEAVDNEFSYRESKS